MPSYIKNHISHIHLQWEVQMNERNVVVGNQYCGLALLDTDSKIKKDFTTLIKFYVSNYLEKAWREEIIY